jgi:hypothetical protein
VVLYGAGALDAGFGEPEYEGFGDGARVAGG